MCDRLKRRRGAVPPNWMIPSFPNSRWGTPVLETLFRRSEDRETAFRGLVPEPEPEFGNEEWDGFRHSTA